jgi:hypothetical protein
MRLGLGNFFGSIQVRVALAHGREVLVVAGPQADGLPHFRGCAVERQRSAVEQGSLRLEVEGKKLRIRLLPPHQVGQQRGNGRPCTMRPG